MWIIRTEKAEMPSMNAHHELLGKVSHNSHVTEEFAAGHVVHFRGLQSFYYFLLLLEPADFLANILVTSLLLPGRRGGGQDADCGRRRLRPVQWHRSQVQMLLFSQCSTPTSPPDLRPLNIRCWNVGVGSVKTWWATATWVKRMLCCIAGASSKTVKTKNSICLFSYEVTVP